MTLARKVVVLGKQYDVTVDPPGATDTALIIYGSILCGTTTLILLYAWVHRNYHPIRAKRLVMTTIMQVVGVLWFIGDLARNGHTKRTGAWLNCKLWYLWFCLLPCYAFFTTVLSRLYALDRVFVQHKPFSGRVIYIISIASSAFFLIVSLVGQLLNGKYSIALDPEVKVCVTSKEWTATSLVIGLALWICLIVLLIRLRNINSSFNEFRESLTIFLITMGFIVELAAVNATHPMFPLEKTYRFITTFFDITMVNMITLLVLVYPVYKCMFCHHEYEIEWRLKLSRDQLEKEYEVTPANIPTENEQRTNVNTHFDEYDLHELNSHGSGNVSNDATFTRAHGIYQNHGLPPNSHQISEPIFTVSLAKDLHPNNRTIL
ncbi:hypothetical protein GGI12_000445 [Dipsacomyces acuminosporus]|nr:hypothetical protein GGI12_000445 [Dipsacomyces acuminosporus]